MLLPFIYHWHGAQETISQATVRAPPERNMTRKTLPFMYGVGIPPFLLISFICYWAYGNDVAPNVLDNLSGPKWAVALAYIAGAAQIIVSFHVIFPTSCALRKVAVVTHYSCEYSRPKWAVALAYNAGAAHILVSFLMTSQLSVHHMMLLLLHVSEAVQQPLWQCMAALHGPNCCLPARQLPCCTCA